MKQPSNSFDQYASNYEEALQKGISASGESAAYFAAGRVEWTRYRLKRENLRSILDFGCGTGNGIQFLQKTFQPAELFGLDTSEESLVQARKRFSDVVFCKPSTLPEEMQFDLVFCNGVFHHIPLNARAEVVRYLYSHVKPGGTFAFWENNPWNPGTRYVMSRIPFDHDAITLSIPEAKSMLSQAGFRIVRTDSRFYFPRLLAWLRVLEPWLTMLPLGAQYMILSQRPIAQSG